MSLVERLAGVGRQVTQLDDTIGGGRLNGGGVQVHFMRAQVVIPVPYAARFVQNRAHLAVPAVAPPFLVLLDRDLPGRAQRSHS